jgi:hypothetical protein
MEKDTVGLARRDGPEVPILPSVSVLVPMDVTTVILTIFAQLVTNTMVTMKSGDQETTDIQNVSTRLL